jgi:hypothetical protein
MTWCAILCCFCLTIGMQASVRMGIVTRSTFYGERELGWRIKLAAEQLGWEAFLDESEGSGLETIPNLDWVICLVPRIIPGCPNYLALFDDVRHFDDNGKLLACCEQYDGYLLTISEEAFKGKKMLFSIPFFPTVQDTPYQRLSLNNMVTMMPVWGNRRHQKKYKDLYHMLSSSGFVSFYGRSDRLGVIQKGYLGALPFDGVSVIEAFQRHGIVLVLHSKHHLFSKIPSGRIFEAAAASVVIISDQNAFVQEHFGDSVYYVDETASSEEIYAQIEKYVKEIREDPERALQKAAKAHRIFEEKFLMTSQLLLLQNAHQKEQI